MGSLSLLEGIFPTQESNWGLLRCRQILYQLFLIFLLFEYNVKTMFAAFLNFLSTFFSFWPTFIFLLFLFCLVQFLCYSQQFLFSIGPILERNPGRSVIRFTGLACSSQLSPYYGPFFSTGGQNLPIYASALTFGEGDGTPLQYSCLEGPMAWMEEPGRLRSMGSLRVGQD